MTPTVIQRYALAFGSHLPGRIVRLNVPRADDTKTEDEVRDAMQAVIDADDIYLPTAQGFPRTIHSARLITVTRTPIAV